jgi:hypothetical protein
MQQLENTQTLTVKSYIGLETNKKAGVGIRKEVKGRIKKRGREA